MSKQQTPETTPQKPAPQAPEQPAPQQPQQQAQPAPAPAPQAPTAGNVTIHTSLNGQPATVQVPLAAAGQILQAQSVPTTNNNTQEVTNMNANVNTIPTAIPSTTGEISAPAEFRQALANQGLNEYGLLQQVSAGVGAGAISRASVNTAVRQGELMAKLSRQQQREAERAAWVAQRKAELNSRFGNTDLTIGQTILIGVGIVATVLIVGGLVWWLIRKFRDKDAELISDTTTDGAKALNAANAAWISY